jgi:hypothetical protein
LVFSTPMAAATSPERRSCSPTAGR